MWPEGAPKEWGNIRLQQAYFATTRRGCEGGKGLGFLIKMWPACLAIKNVKCEGQLANRLTAAQREANRGVRGGWGDMIGAYCVAARFVAGVLWGFLPSLIVSFMGSKF